MIPPARPKLNRRSSLYTGLVGLWAPPNGRPVSSPPSPRDGTTNFPNLVNPADNHYLNEDYGPSGNEGHQVWSGLPEWGGRGYLRKTGVADLRLQTDSTIYSGPTTNGDAHTVLMWVYLTTAHGTRSWMAGTNNFAGSGHWGVNAENTSYFQYNYLTAWTTRTNGKSWSGGIEGKWFRIGMRLNFRSFPNASADVFENGIQQATTSSGGGAAMTSRPLFVGNWASGTEAANNEWQGYIAHVCYWDRALSDGEIHADWDPKSRWDLIRPEPKFVPFVPATGLETLAVAGAVTSAGVVGFEVQRALAGATTPSGAVSSTRAALVALGGGASPSGALVARTELAIDGSSAPSGALAHRAEKDLGGGFTPSGVVAAVRAALVALGGGASPSGALAHRAEKALAGSSTPTGDVAKRPELGFAGSITPSGAVAAVRAALVSIAGAITPAGALGTRPDKALAGSSTPSGALAHRAEKALDGGTTPGGVAALVRAALATLVGAITPAGTVSNNSLGLTRKRSIRWRIDLGSVRRVELPVGTRRRVRIDLGSVRRFELPLDRVD